MLNLVVIRMNNKIIIAVDGYASCGKSTLAKQLAQKLNYIYIDSGAMYRAVTLYLLQNQIDIADEAAVAQVLPNIHIGFQKTNPDTEQAETYLNGKNVERQIRSREVSAFVSQVSALAPVRHYLVAQQQEFGKNKGLTMDGRDIGTVVFPQAELKLFLTADLATRTQRRYEELQSKGIVMSLAEIEHNLQLRDHIDTTRAESPLRRANDAIILDNSQLTPNEQLNLALSLVEEKLTAKA